MKPIFSILSVFSLLAVSLLALAMPSSAACKIDNGNVRILSNDFPALRIVNDMASACTGGTVSANMTKENKDIQIPALTPNPAEYSVAVVANATFTPLYSNDLIRPMNDLVQSYGQSLSPSQLIKVGGNIMAVAFMANTQHLFYRADILQKAGVPTPKTYEEVLAAAKAIRDKGLLQYPIAGTYKAGWNLAEEFVNMYMGYGGDFFKKNSAEPNINNAKGIAALEMMKSLTAYMNPDYLTFDSTAVAAEIEAGNVALTNLWASRAAAVTDNEGSTPAITKSIQFAVAPTVGGRSIPATTLWWDGFVVAKNTSAMDAKASFQAMVQSLTPQMANANSDAASWLIKGYKPTRTTQSVVDTASAGAKPYPMLPYMGLLHTALGNELPDYFQGRKTAAKALADVEASYRTKAIEAGYLK